MVVKCRRRCGFSRLRFLLIIYSFFHFIDGVQSPTISVWAWCVIAVIGGRPVQDNMCSGINAIFGKDRKDTIYSVIHQLSLEVDGIRLMKRMSRISGCEQPTGAFNMNMGPDCIKNPSWHRRSGCFDIQSC